ncbi:hypothetical protein B4113_0695 [Geobacillus sp. B4113_201601]|nr:hypothetical protein B4113_0695 [Geobacillus sp. B4113_201601]
MLETVAKTKAWAKVLTSPCQPPCKNAVPPLGPKNELTLIIINNYQTFVSCHTS